MSKRLLSRLNEKQRRFVEAYLVEPNATRAAKIAGYSPGRGPQLLRNRIVREVLDDARMARARRVNVTADEVLERLIRVVSADIRDAFDDDSRMVPVKKFNDDLAFAVTSLDNEEIAAAGENIGSVKKIRLADKLKALEMLGRHLGMWKDRTEVSGPDGAGLTVVVKTIKDENR